MWRMVTHPGRVPKRGDVPIIKKQSIARQYIDEGYDACTKAKHKMQLPNF